MTRFWVVLFLILGSVGVARAEVTVSAEMAPRQAAVGERINYSVNVSGEARKIAEPVLPDLPAFEVAGSGTSTFFTSVNGQVTRRKAFTFTLVARSEGSQTIEGATVTVDGKRYLVPPVSVEVTAASNRSRAQPPSRNMPFGGLNPIVPMPGRGLREGDVTIETEVDRKHPYVGEQVILTFRLKRAVNLFGSPDYTEPEVTGFRKQPLEFPGGKDTVSRVEGGRRWVIQEIRTALFPLQPGPLTVGPARLTFTVDPFAGGQALMTDPIQLEARPLPAEGRPADFSGAVGKFSLAAVLDRTDASVGDSLTLTVTVSGRGNFNGLEGVSLPDLPGFDVYDPEVTDNLTYEPDGVTGSRSFSYILIPRAEGSRQLGPVRLVTFDPEAETYRTAEAGPFTVAVAPARATASSEPPPEPAARTVSGPTREEALLWAGLAFAAGLLVLIAREWMSLKKRKATAPVQAQRKPYFADRKTLYEVLGRVQRQDDEAFLRDVDRSLRDFLGERWGLTAARVDVGAVDRNMNGMPPECRQVVREALEAVATARYAPGGGGLAREELLSRVREAARAVEGLMPGSPG